jgi:hypothetical protein
MLGMAYLQVNFVRQPDDKGRRTVSQPSKESVLNNSAIRKTLDAVALHGGDAGRSVARIDGENSIFSRR